MTPEARGLLDKARRDVAFARHATNGGYHDEAGRSAYLAMFHAAAYLSERTGRVPKTHAGVHGQFGLIARDDPIIGSGRTALLAEAFGYKSAADYLVGQFAQAEEAESLIARAQDFVGAIEAALTR